MSYRDESEYDDDPRRRDRPAGADGRRRATQPARPAWDAATYGTPDDLRRARPEPTADRYEPPYDEPRYDEPRYDETSWSSAEPSAPSSGSYEPDPYPAARTNEYLGGIDYAQPEYAQPEYPPATDYASTDYNTDYGTSEYGSTEYGAADYVSPDYGAAPTLGAPEYGSPGDHPADGNGYSPALDDRSGVTSGMAAYPGGLTEDPGPTAGAGRAGRNLPAAIGVGVGLAAAALGSLFFWRPAFLGVLAVAVGIGIWELVRATRTRGVNPPLIPLVAGGGLMSGLAWWGHVDALTFGLIITVLAAMVWRLADGAGGYGPDVAAAALVAVYVPFLAGFAALLASAPADGDLRVLVTLAGVVLSDTGGYVAGVFFGRHPMAPLVSPKKSWEGLAGSLIATAVGGAVLLYFLFDVQPWWGALFGLAVSAAAVLGDLGESMIKRDLGVKDMSSLLPGHGGLMDRLDSILFAAPTAYIMLVLIAPPV
jgi:phosphatidate cytidylyltransferase